MPAALFNEFFHGWLAFKSGRAVRTRSGKIRVFANYENALAAARKSTQTGMGKIR